MPLRAIKAAAEAQCTPDEFYCLRLLLATGIKVVPGSGFSKPAATVASNATRSYLRTSLLAPGSRWIQNWVEFHNGFMDEFR